MKSEPEVARPAAARGRGAARLLAVAAAGCFVSGCDGSGPVDAQAERADPAAIIEIALAEGAQAEADPLRRPVVRFDHRLHTDQLAQQGCDACHPQRTGDTTPAAQQPLELDLRRSLGATDRDGLMDAYHELCMGCHRERAAQGQSVGALACGECHVERAARAPARVAMSFDYALHYRHSEAEQEECSHCHHTERAPSGELVHESGTEEACRGCHGQAEQAGRSSLRAAAHQDCVNCHLERRGADQDAGPVECAGCHAAAARAAIQPPEDWESRWQAPEVGQPEAVWLRAAGAESALVPFDHAAHEPRAASCSGCHHQRLQSCADCHTLTGSDDGGGVTLEDAFHRATASQSCVGCHQRRAQAEGCVGCHGSMGRPPTESACARCHSGPAAGAARPETPPSRSAVELSLLPEEGDDFPREVLIDSLAADYTAVQLPHQQIVAALDTPVRDSALARRFHGSTDALCAGCHHQSPRGARPPPCRSCHGRAAHATDDLPGLQAAYHRQCLGCHQRMAIEPLSCTEGCHQPQAKESRP